MPIKIALVAFLTIYITTNKKENLTQSNSGKAKLKFALYHLGSGRIKAIIYTKG